MGACSLVLPLQTRRASRPWPRPDSPCSSSLPARMTRRCSLPRDGRVLEHGQPGAVLEAVAAAPLDPSDLRRALTGCADAPDVQSARQVGPDWRVVLMGRARSISVATTVTVPGGSLGPFIA